MPHAVCTTTIVETLSRTHTHTQTGTQASESRSSSSGRFARRNNSIMIKFEPYLQQSYGIGNTIAVDRWSHRHYPSAVGTSLSAALRKNHCQFRKCPSIKCELKQERRMYFYILSMRLSSLLYASCAHHEHRMYQERVSASESRDSWALLWCESIALMIQPSHLAICTNSDNQCSCSC